VELRPVLLRRPLLKRLWDYPDTYEKLVALVAKQHPGWTRAEVEAHIARVNAAPKPGP
jgi:hypothetical protein